MFRKIIAGSLAVLSLFCCSITAFATPTAGDTPIMDVVPEYPSSENTCSYRDYQFANSEIALATPGSRSRQMEKELTFISPVTVCA